MTQRFCLPLFLLLSVVFSGCASLDTTPEPKGDRVMKGTINFPVSETPNAVLTTVVRLWDVTQVDNPIVVAEQTIEKSQSPVAFELAYRAEQITSPKRARIEARVSENGKLKYYSRNSYAVTNDSADRDHRITLDSVAR